MSYRYSPLDSQYPSSPITAILLDDDLVWLDADNSDIAAEGHDALRIRLSLKPYFHEVFIFNTIDAVVDKITEFASVGIDCVLLIDGTFHERRAIELRAVQRTRRQDHMERRGGHADHAQVDVAHDEGLVCDASDAQRELKRRLAADNIDLGHVPFVAISWSTDQKRIDRMQTAGFAAFVENCDRRDASGLFVALAHVLRHQHRLYSEWMERFLRQSHLAQDSRGRLVFVNPAQGQSDDRCTIFPRATPSSNNAETTVEKLIEGARTDPVFDEVYRKSGLRRAMAEALFRLRKAANLTQAALGEKAKWAQPYVARLERGGANSVSAMEGIERYANACGVSAVVLFVDPHTQIVQSGIALREEPAMKAFVAKVEGTSAEALQVPVVLKDMQDVMDETQSTLSTAIQQAKEHISRLAAASVATSARVSKRHKATLRSRKSRR